jgi:hypothetical protein
MLTVADLYLLARSCNERSASVAQMILINLLASDNLQ